MIGEDPEPLQVSRLEAQSTEERDHPQHLPAEGQRLAGKALDALGLRPLGLQQPVTRPALQEQRRVLRSDVTYFSVAQGDPPMGPVGARPARRRIDDGGSDARPELEVGRFVTVVAEQPDARERDALGHPEPPDHFGQDHVW